MAVEILGFGDLPSIDELNQMELDVCDKSKIFLTAFFMQHSCANTYLLRLSREELRHYDDFYNGELFNSFGVQIFSEGSIYDSVPIHNLLVLTEEEVACSDFESLLEEKKNGNSCIRFTHGIVLHKFNAEDEKEQDLIQDIVSGIESVTFWNSALEREGKRQAVERLEIRTLHNIVHEDGAVDAAACFGVYADQLGFANRTKLTLEICNRIQQFGTSKPIVYSGIWKSNKSKASLGNTESLAFSAIAAYLSIHSGQYFDILDSGRQLFLRNLMDLKAPCYHYVDTYYNLVMNAPEIGVYLHGSQCYLAIADRAAVHKNPDKAQIRFSAAMLPFSLETLDFVEDTVETQSFYYREVEFLPLREVLGLADTNWDVAKQNTLKCNTLLRKFSMTLQEQTSLLNSVLLNFTNVALMRVHGNLKLAYISNASCEIPYIMVPAAEMYGSFSHTFNLSNLNGIVDISIFEDWKEYVKLCSEEGLITGDRVQTEYPPYIRGMLLRAGRLPVSLVQEDCGFTFEEVGIWMEATKTFRGSSGKRLATYLQPDKLWASNSISCYGGPHPGITTTINITTETWR